MKILTMVLVAVMTAGLVGCTPQATEAIDKSRAYVMPEGMNDCKVFRLNSSSDRDIFVVRCPMTTTTAETHSCGKGCTEKNDVTAPNYY